MTNSEILSHIDHTLLRPTATRQEIFTLCDEAARYCTASVCIPPAYVRAVREKYPELNICTVIGFPLGYNTTAVKCYEAADAISAGADEIDMVINLGMVKNGDMAAVENEIAAVKRTCGKITLKVIVETCYLTEEEKTALCGCVTRAGADYIKTSTGFGTAGACIEDIHLFSRRIGPGVKMKAAGGVKSREDLEMFLNAGCDRIGTSSAVKMLISDRGDKS